MFRVERINIVQTSILPKGLCLIIMCQYSFINANKCTTLVSNVDNGGDYVCVVKGDKWEIPPIFL